MVEKAWNAEVERRLTEGVEQHVAAHTRATLRALSQLGCEIVLPVGTRDDYFNIVADARRESGRVCSVHCRTGRVEFQTASYSLARKEGIAQRFKSLASGDKAALTPETAEDLDVVVKLARSIIAGRRG